MSDSQTKYPLHTRYTWDVQTVPLDKAKDVLDGLTSGTFEVVSTHVHTSPTDGSPHVVILARQSHAVSVTIGDLQIGGNAMKNGTFFAGQAPLDGDYTPECKHDSVHFDKNAAFDMCAKCRKPVRWKIKSLDVYKQ